MADTTSKAATKLSFQWWPAVVTLALLFGADVTVNVVHFGHNVDFRIPLIVVGVAGCIWQSMNLFTPALLADRVKWSLLTSVVTGLVIWFCPF